MGRVHKRKLVEYTEEVDTDQEHDKNGEKNPIIEGEENENNNTNTENNADEFESLQVEIEEAAAETGRVEKAVRKGKRCCPGGDSDDEPLLLTKPRKISGPKIGGSVSGANGNGGARGRSSVGKLQKKATVKKRAEDEEYEVKEVVGHKREGGVDHYLIRWKGYTKDDDTWESANTLSCPELIEKFEKKAAAKKSTLKKSTTTVASKKARSPDKITKEDPNKQWEVEKIIDYAEERSGRVFRIRWKGYGPKHDTWEPEKNLCCDEVIDKFMQRIKSQEHLSFKELRHDPKKPRRLYNETAPRTNLTNAIGRTSKRSTTKKRVFYGDSD